MHQDTTGTTAGCRLLTFVSSRPYYLFLIDGDS